MKNSGSKVDGQRNGVPSGSGKSAERAKMPSLRMVAACLLMIALVMALGMTGGQVRQLADRVTAIESERDEFHRRLVSLREDNMGLLARLRDYQGVLEVAQESNVSLSKRVANRELAVNDLQDTLDSVLVEKYATEKAMRAEIAALENKKLELDAQVAALGEAVAAQGEEIAILDESYRGTQRKLADTQNDHGRLLTENNRYLGMMSDLQDSLEAMQGSNRELVTNFDELREETEVIREEKIGLERELEAIKSGVISPGSIGIEPIGEADPFGIDSSTSEEGSDGSSGVIAEAGGKSA